MAAVSQGVRSGSFLTPRTPPDTAARPAAGLPLEAKGLAGLRRVMLRLPNSLWQACIFVSWLVPAEDASWLIPSGCWG